MGNLENLKRWGNQRNHWDIVIWGEVKKRWKEATTHDTWVFVSLRVLSEQEGWLYYSQLPRAQHNSFIWLTFCWMGLNLQGLLGGRGWKGKWRGGSLRPWSQGKVLLNHFTCTTFCDMEHKIPGVDSGLDLAVSRFQLKSKLMEIPKTVHAWVIGGRYPFLQPIKSIC